jgi:His/Glu/Gln/Arg/opine family amino acid ABC transporter permease subunit
MCRTRITCRPAVSDAAVSHDLIYLLIGAWATIKISALATVFGLLTGVLAAVLRQSNVAPLRACVAIYANIVRGTPLFMQIMVIYFLLPAVGIDVNRVVAGVIALSLNSGAYISEMIRGALTSIAPGEIEAAQALAMPNHWIWLRIVLPQVFTLILPPLTIEFAALVKGSALLSIIGVVELTRSAQQIISATFEPLPTWVETALIYFVICFCLGQMTRIMRNISVGRPL